MTSSTRSSTDAAAASAVDESVTRGAPARMNSMWFFVIFVDGEDVFGVDLDLGYLREPERRLCFGHDSPERLQGHWLIDGVAGREMVAFRARGGRRARTWRY